MEKSTKDYLNTIPKKVLCSNELSDGTQICNSYLATALKYIQVNSPWEKHFLVFDVDRHDATIAAEEADLPAPTITTINPKNHHAHLLYQLHSPVITGPKGHHAPAQFYCDLDACFTFQLNADRGYNKVLTKTPGHDAWRTIYTGVKYELNELRDYVTVDVSMAKAAAKTFRDGIVPDSRHISCFNLLRRWAYEQVDMYRQQSDLTGFFTAALEKAEDFCSGCIHTEIPHKPVLPASQQISLAKSVTFWTWANYKGTSSDPAFRELQSKRAIKRWGDSQQSRIKAQELRAMKLSYQEIANRLGISKRTITRWLAA